MFFLTFYKPKRNQLIKQITDRLIDPETLVSSSPEVYFEVTATVKSWSLLNNLVIRGATVPLPPSQLCHYFKVSRVNAFHVQKKVFCKPENTFLGLSKVCECHEQQSS